MKIRELHNSSFNRVWLKTVMTLKFALKNCVDSISQTLKMFFSRPISCICSFLTEVSMNFKVFRTPNIRQGLPWRHRQILPQVFSSHSKGPSLKSRAKSALTVNSWALERVCSIFLKNVPGSSNYMLRLARASASITCGRMQLNLWPSVCNWIFCLRM